MDTTNRFDKLKEWIHSTHLTPELITSIKPNSKPVVTADPGIIVEDYLHKLAANHILSAPFHLEDKVYFVDVLMILTRFAHHFKEKKPNSLTHDIVIQDSIKYFGQPVDKADLLNPSLFSQHTNFGTTLYDVAKTLSNANFHRLFVRSTDNSGFMSIFSESDFIFLIYQKLSELGQFSSSSIAECGLISKPAITVTTDKSAMDTLEILAKRQVGVVVIVNANKVFQDTLAAADFRGFMRENYSLLSKHVLEYKQFNCHRKGISCLENITFGELISLFVTNKTHHVCVVDGEGHATGLISLSDVLNFIVNHTGK